MGKTLRPIWLVVKLAVQADPRRAALVVILELTNGLCVATWALWLKLLADAAVDRDLTLALVAAASGAGAAHDGNLFAGWLGANAQTILRERTGLALEERLVQLSLGIPGLEHYESPDYRDTLALLREERGKLGNAFYAIISGMQMLVRFGATVVLLISVHFSLVLLPLFGLVLLVTGRRAERIRQAAMEATAEPQRDGETTSWRPPLPPGPQRNCWCSVLEESFCDGIKTSGVRSIGHGQGLPSRRWRSTPSAGWCSLSVTGRRPRFPRGWP